MKINYFEKLTNGNSKEIERLEKSTSYYKEYNLFIKRIADKYGHEVFSSEVYTPDFKYNYQKKDKYTLSYYLGNIKSGMDGVKTTIKSTHSGEMFIVNILFLEDQEICCNSTLILKYIYNKSYSNKIGIKIADYSALSDKDIKKTENYIKKYICEFDIIPKITGYKKSFWKEKAEILIFK
jgi:hypothetical protein